MKRIHLIFYLPIFLLLCFGYFDIESKKEFESLCLKAEPTIANCFDNEINPKTYISPKLDFICLSGCSSDNFDFLKKEYILSYKKSLALTNTRPFKKFTYQPNQMSDQLAK